VFDGVCCVCIPTTKHGGIVLEEGLRGKMFAFRRERVAVG
jgi:hypothetical protein